MSSFCLGRWLATLLHRVQILAQSTCVHSCLLCKSTGGNTHFRIWYDVSLQSSIVPVTEQVLRKWIEVWFRVLGLLNGWNCPGFYRKYIYFLMERAMIWLPKDECKPRHQEIHGTQVERGNLSPSFCPKNKHQASKPDIQIHVEGPKISV